MNSTHDEGLTNDLNLSTRNVAGPSSFQTETRTVTVTETTVERSVKGEWQSVPALNVNETVIAVKGKWLKTAYIHDEEWLKCGFDDPVACVRGLKDRRAKTLAADIFTFPQTLPATTPQYPYYLEWDSVAAIHVTSFKDWWEKVPHATRKNVRRAEKRAVEVKVKQLDDDLVRDIVELTNDSPTRQGKPFLHYGKTFEEVKKDQSTHVDHSDFICAYSGANLIGLLKLVYGKQTASVLQFFPKASEQDKRPANALIAKGVEICEAKGISYFIYGKFNYGNKRHSSLLEFKIRNGFEEILVPRFYVPLTAKGAVCIKLGLHRGLMGLLPDIIIRAVVNLRAKWYEFVNPLGRCSSTTEQPNSIRQTDGSTPPTGSSQDGSNQ